MSHAGLVCGLLHRSHASMIRSKADGVAVDGEIGE